MSKIVFTPPDQEAPGFLRRVRAAVGYVNDLQSDPTQDRVDQIVNFLLPFVMEPEDREQAHEALLDASKKQFIGLLRAIISGGDANPTE